MEGLIALLPQAPLPVGKGSFHLIGIEQIIIFLADNIDTVHGFTGNALEETGFF